VSDKKKQVINIIFIYHHSRISAEYTFAQLAEIIDSMPALQQYLRRPKNGLFP